jgi:hypothetical protein
MSQKGQHFKHAGYPIVGGSIFLVLGLFFLLSPAGQTEANIGWAGFFNLKLWMLGALLVLCSLWMLVLGIRQAILRLERTTSTRVPIIFIMSG